MNIFRATKEHEAWLRRETHVVESGLRLKHEQMKEDPFLFLRATFYRWIGVWRETCKDLARAPTALCVGDLHVESFGTWRDKEARLAWGVDDFDEAYPLPYTSDLVRLATSAKMAIDLGHLAIDLKGACEAILEGYGEGLRKMGAPIVLAEHHKWLSGIAISELHEPGPFWKELNELPAARANLPKGARMALESMLPEPRLAYKVVRRTSGLGSLGHQRLVAIAAYHGGLVAREAKAMVPSACFWADGRSSLGNRYYRQALEHAVRSPDPCHQTKGDWRVKRLSPDSSPIVLADLPEERDEQGLLYTMGCEAANVHLGTKGRVKAIQRHLNRQPSKWLRSAAKDMAKVVNRDWKKWKEG
jgi:hypothetical protein